MSPVVGAYCIRPTDGPAEPNDGRVMGGFWGRRLGIWICFSNRVHISVGDTGMFSPPAGGVRGAYAIRPYTCYMPYIKIRIRFPNWVYVSIRDTAMFFERGICFG